MEECRISTNEKFVGQSVHTRVGPWHWPRSERNENITDNSFDLHSTEQAREPNLGSARPAIFHHSHHATGIRSIDAVGREVGGFRCHEGTRQRSGIAEVAVAEVATIIVDGSSHFQMCGQNLLA